MFIDQTEKFPHQMTGSRRLAAPVRQNGRSFDLLTYVLPIPKSLKLDSSVNSRLHRCSRATPNFCAVFTTADPVTPAGREIGTR